MLVRYTSVEKHICYLIAPGWSTETANEKLFVTLSPREKKF
jgi:hypothetical protein